MWHHGGAVVRGRLMRGAVVVLAAALGVAALSTAVAAQAAEEDEAVAEPVEPTPQFTSVAARLLSLLRSVQRRQRGLLGRERLGAGGTPDRAVQRRRGRSPPQLRPGIEHDDHLLGRRHPRPDRRPRRPLPGHQCRGLSLVRRAPRREHRLLGQQRLQPEGRAGRDLQRRRRRGPGIRAGCGPMPPSPAGATTPSARTDAPTGEFSAVATGDQHSCGLGSDATLTCWGADFVHQTDAPHRRVQRRQRRHLAHVRACGPMPPSPAGATATTARPTRPPESSAPSSRGGLHSCGLRADGTIECWGNLHRLTAAPDGRFSALNVGAEHSCALAQRRHRRLLGQTTPPGGPARRPASSARSPPENLALVRAGPRCHARLLG